MRGPCIDSQPLPPLSKQFKNDEAAGKEAGKAGKKKKCSLHQNTKSGTFCSTHVCPVICCFTNPVNDVNWKCVDT